MNELLELLAAERFDAVRERLRELDPADLADFIEEAAPDVRERIFEMLDVETASDVIVELETNFVDEVVDAMTSDQIADLADQMAPDDAADFLADLDQDQRVEVLAAMEAPATVTKLLPYREDSAGHVMTTEVYAMPGTAKAAEAKAQLGNIRFSDPIFYVHVIDAETGKLQGQLLLNKMLAADPDVRLADIAETTFPFAYADEDQEEVARKFRKYDLWVIPVVDRANRLIGRITADDIMDVIHEEADEDLAHMVGAPDIEEEEESPFRIVRMRLPWLMITLFVGFINSIIISTMLDVTKIVAIAVFVPAILAMGGNTGMQSSAIAVRGIALGLKKYSRLFELVQREVVVGTMLGICCGTAAGFTVWTILTLMGADTGGISTVKLGIAVGVAMWSAMTFASCFGSIFPILLHRLRIDPAVASGPFVTTSNDLSSALIYFLTCVIILKTAAG